MSSLHQSSPQSGKSFDQLSVGMSASLTRTVTEADIVKFAEVSGDTNPMHLDEAFASASIFKSRVAHGALTSSYISAVLGTKLPGPGAIYLSQSVKFKAPVRIGDVVTARSEITGLDPDRKLVTFKTQCLIGDKVVVDGEATLIVPERV